MDSKAHSTIDYTVDFTKYCNPLLLNHIIQTVFCAVCYTVSSTVGSTENSMLDSVVGFYTGLTVGFHSGSPIRDTNVAPM